MRCTDNLAWGHAREPKQTALLRRYIRLNTEGRVSWLFFDIDRDDAALAYDEANVAVPNVVVQNPENGHAHLGYCLETPIITSNKARQKPLAFQRAIARGMTRRLGADLGYRNYLSKNPLHPDWRTTWLQRQLYQLHDLAFWLEPEDMQFTREASTTEFADAGRNCALTSELGKFGLRMAWRHRDIGGSFEEFRRVLQERAFDLNSDFEEPLRMAELVGIVRSIGNWSWSQSTREMFSEIQRHRARKRRREKEQIMNDISNLNDLNAAELARKLGCSKRHARRYRSTPREQYEANSLARVKPWEASGISRSKWYRQHKSERVKTP